MDTLIGEQINHPEHYQGQGIECIDAMEVAYGTQAIIDFCRCNAFKYQWRAGKKGSLSEDINKAQWYQNKMMELIVKISS